MEDRTKLLTGDYTESYRQTVLLVDIAESLERISQELYELNKVQSTKNNKMTDINEELKRMRVSTSLKNIF